MRGIGVDVMNKYIKHLLTITKHKFVVMKYCFKCGIYKRGLLHDLSKYGITEFASSARYFQGNSSPIDAEKREKGYSLAWQHHKGHNPHHWEYWIDNIGTYKNTAIKIPYEYVVEMVCDWLGAGIVYSKQKVDENKPYKEPKQNHRFMLAIGNFATNNPWLVIIVTGAILIALAFASTNIKYNYDLLSSFPDDMDSVEGFTLIEENFSAGELAPVKVIVDTEGKDINIAEELAALPYVAVVGDVQTGESDANYQLYEVDLNKNPYSNEAMDDVEQMKEDVKGILADVELGEANFWLGGETSEQIDARDVQANDERVIEPVMIVIIFLVLVVYLRALLTSIQLMATVVVSFFAALGAGWLIITGILGQEAMASSIPLYSFVFIIALGNDYNIFMISDIWKNRKRGLGHKESIAKGVASTGAVITSAGLILAGTFGVLATLPIQLLVQFGIVTAIGVLLDTFIVRPLLVPALITVFGRLSYWPGKLWKKEM